MARKEKVQSSNNYLSRTNTDCLKGIFACCVLLCHLRGKISFFNDTLIGSALTALGYMSVAMFFFFSGYGLTVSYKKKGRDYIREFPRKRILSFYSTYLIAVFIYAVYNMITGGALFWSWQTPLKTLTFGGTIIHNGWYLQAILLFYIIFWLVFRFVKDDNRKILAIIISLVAYVLACLFIFNLGELWCESSFAFVLGIIWATKQDEIDGFLERLRIGWLVFIGLVALTLVSTLLGWNTSLKDYVRIPIKMVSAVSFVLVILLMIRRIPVNCVVTRFLGKISFEIYILHGLFIHLFCVVCNITNAFVFTPLILVCTLLSAIGLNLAISFLRIKQNKTSA